jgi:hypothetical protein
VLPPAFVETVIDAVPALLVRGSTMHEESFPLLLVQLELAVERVP